MRGNAVLHRFLAVVREMRNMFVSQAGVAEGNAILDGVAGCEFVDDRIRLPE